MQQSENRTERMILALKNRRGIAIILILALSLISLDSFISAVSRHSHRVRSLFESNEPRAESAASLNEEGEFIFPGGRVTFEQLGGSFDIDYVRVNTVDHRQAIFAEHAWARTRYPHLRVIRQKFIARTHDGEFSVIAAWNWEPEELGIVGNDTRIIAYYDILWLEAGTAMKIICFDITSAVKGSTTIVSDSDILSYISSIEDP
ncbi:MAG: hypothetical protein HQ523_04145 [Lentisphaerae bacterium]|nr:hypothetical protein [Lentisphaerota bacterium]